MTYDDFTKQAYEHLSNARRELDKFIETCGEMDETAARKEGIKIDDALMKLSWEFSK